MIRLRHCVFVCGIGLGPQQEVLPNESALRTLFGKYFGEVHALDRFPVCKTNVFCVSLFSPSVQDGKKCFIWFVSADDAGEVIKQARGDILKFPEGANEDELSLFPLTGLTITRGRSTAICQTWTCRPVETQL